MNQSDCYEVIGLFTLSHLFLLFYAVEITFSYSEADRYGFAP